MSTRERIGLQWVQEFSHGPNFNAITEPGTVLGALHSPVVRFIREYCEITGSERVLEAGCGSGLYSLALATLGCRCTALDLSAQMLTNVSLAAEMMRRHGHASRVETVKTDLNNIQLPDYTFDVAFNEGVIEHWLSREDRIHILREMARVTRPGGRVAVCIPNNAHPFYRWWYFLQRTFRSAQLRFRPGGSLEEAIISADMLAGELVDAGLVDVQTDGFAVTRTIAHYPKWKVLRALAKGLDILFPPFRPDTRRRWGVYLLAVGRKRAEISDSAESPSSPLP